jgi:hypothetical protein
MLMLFIFMPDVLIWNAFACSIYESYCWRPIKVNQWMLTASWLDIVGSLAYAFWWTSHKNSTLVSTGSWVLQGYADAWVHQQSSASYESLHCQRRVQKLCFLRHTYLSAWLKLLRWMPRSCHCWKSPSVYKVKLVQHPSQPLSHASLASAAS